MINCIHWGSIILTQKYVNDIIERGLVDCLAVYMLLDVYKNVI